MLVVCVIAAYFCLFYMFSSRPHPSPYSVTVVFFWIWKNCAMLCVNFMHYQFVRTARAWDLASAAVNKVGYRLMQQTIDCDACKGHTRAGQLW